MTRDDIIRRVQGIPSAKAARLEKREREGRMRFSSDVRHNISSQIEKLMHDMKTAVAEETRRTA